MEQGHANSRKEHTPFPTKKMDVCSAVGVILFNNGRKYFLRRS
jgi:hypothetical protein